MSTENTNFSYLVWNGKSVNGWTVKKARQVISDRMIARNEDDAWDKGIIGYDNDNDLFIFVRYGNVVLKEIKCSEECDESDALNFVDEIRKEIEKGAFDDEIMMVRRRRYGTEVSRIAA